SRGRMRRTPSIVSIDATARLAIEEARSRLAPFSHRASLVHDGAVFRAAQVIISTSDWAGRDLAALYPDCAAKVRVMPYPIESSLFDSSWVEERAARAAATPEGPVRALFIGGDFVRKGGAELLTAWRDARLAARATLDVVTDWPIRSDDVPPGVNLVRGVSPYTP